VGKVRSEVAGDNEKISSIGRYFFAYVEEKVMKVREVKQLKSYVAGNVAVSAL
jgi:hypothetical protein